METLSLDFLGTILRSKSSVREFLFYDHFFASEIHQIYCQYLVGCKYSSLYYLFCEFKNKI